MKKIIIVTSLLLIGMSAFAGEAWKNHVGFGLRLPTGMSADISNKNTDWELKMPVQTGIDLTYTGVHMKTGFSVRGFMDYNLSSSNITAMNPDNTDLYGLNIDAGIGAGWAPIRNKFLLLGLYGVLGLDMSYFPDAAADIKLDSTTTVANTVMYTYGTAFVGGNATLIWTPLGGRFSIFGSATAAYNLPSIYSVEYETRYEYARDTQKTTKADRFDVSPAVKIIPTIGLSWRF